MHSSDDDVDDYNNNNYNLKWKYDYMYLYECINMIAVSVVDHNSRRHMGSMAASLRDGSECT